MPQKGTEGFWKSVAHYVPREATEIRILNPYFIQEAAFQFIGLPFNNGLMGKGVRGALNSCGKCVENQKEGFLFLPESWMRISLLPICFIFRNIGWKGKCSLIISAISLRFDEGTIVLKQWTLNELFNQLFSHSARLQ